MIYKPGPMPAQRPGFGMQQPRPPMGQPMPPMQPPGVYQPGPMPAGNALMPRPVQPMPMQGNALAMWGRR